MPNHIHIIWRMLENHQTSKVKRDFLKFTAQQIRFELQKSDPILLKKFLVNAADRKYQIWQRNSLCMTLYSEKVFKQKLEYIHNNPVQPHWKLSLTPEDYIYSSAKFYKMGIDDSKFLTHASELTLV